MADIDRTIAELKGWSELEDGPFVREDYPNGAWTLAPAHWKSPDGKLHIDLSKWSTDPALALGLLIEMDGDIECNGHYIDVGTIECSESYQTCEPTVEALCQAICEAYVAWKGAKDESTNSI